MKRMNGVKVALATVAIAIAAATPAIAAVDVGGGKWAYGTGSDTAWSNYKHASVNHSSSVQGATFNYSGCVEPGPWALASAQKGSGTAKAFWDKDCTK